MRTANWPQKHLYTRKIQASAVLNPEINPTAPEAQLAPEVQLGSHSNFFICICYQGLPLTLVTKAYA